MKLVAAALMLACVTAVATALPLSRSRGVFITPDNLRSLASYLDHSVTIYDRYIQISTGSSYEDLIRVPLAGPGELDSKVVVRISVAFDPDTVQTTDSDIRVGIQDDSQYNQFHISHEYGNYVCVPYSGSSHENNRASENHLTGHLTMHFHPFHKYGSCESGHDGGYVNVARFNAQVDPTKGLNLQVNRHTSAQQYKIYYFTVELL